ncbi:MAG: ascorbate-dependent monooxygenase [Acidobacteria bacterium]|nr:ascorbate-dependent monooxygenase [Acidobacteriota bacterium]
MGPAVIAAFFAAAAAPTFSHDIAPLVYRRCATCHHGGGVAPFPLLTYREVARHAGQIATVTAKRYMPPWLPTAPHFQHEMKLTPGEIAMFGKWAAEGAPEGNPREEPKAPVFAEGWTLGKPDLEAEMPATFTVPAEGLDVYQCFVIRAPSPRAHWVRAIDIRPGNPKVVHHVILFQDISGTARQRDRGSGYPCFGTPGFLPARGLGGWTPGALPFVSPEGIPELLHANADLVLQVHYHPSGRVETDRTRLAIYYTPQPPKRRMMDIPFTSTRIDIPPGDAAYKVTDHFTVPVDVDAIGVIPHAHYVCRRMYAYAVLPDGTRRTLLSIPNWDFNWQGQYRYAAPIRLPADTRIEMEFTYDNSAANPRNPNQPPARVRYGPGTKDEMAGLHLQVVAVDPADEEELSNTLWGRMIRAQMGR